MQSTNSIIRHNLCDKLVYAEVDSLTTFLSSFSGTASSDFWIDGFDDSITCHLSTCPRYGFNQSWCIMMSIKFDYTSVIKYGPSQWHWSFGLFPLDLIGLKIKQTKNWFPNMVVSRARLVIVLAVLLVACFFHPVSCNFMNLSQFSSQFMHEIALCFYFCLVGFRMLPVKEV